ncbi:MAG: hypothetical protein FWH12_04875 [Treponema sp.]|nr:hypothetical protein [Treponema sp.]
MELYIKTFIVFFIIFFIPIVGIPAQHAESGVLYFHVIDEEETLVFNNYYNQNPRSTFNERGELLHPNLVSSEVIILPVFEMGQQRTNEHGNPDFVAIRTGIRLDRNLIQEVNMETHIFSGEPLISFTLTPEGGVMFFNYTMRNIGELMVIVLNNQVRVIARIIAPIREAGMIQGFNVEEAMMIYDLLK